jgi:CDP-diacylglycerol--glycerol-3-phosphate 3-phosphatidyltransferase
MAPPKNMIQAQPDSKVHLPNILTLGRVLLAIIFVALLSSVRSRSMSVEPTLSEKLGDLSHASTTILVIAAAIFIIAALTDALDGHLARKLNAVTKFGRIMDPFADKLLVLGAFVMLAGPGFTSRVPGQGSIQVSMVAGWMVVAMIARELLVTTIRGVYEGEGVDFSAIGIGKLKMILQSVTVPAVLLLVALGHPGPDSPERTIIALLVWATVIVTILSIFPYIGRAAKHTIDEQAKMLEVMRGKKPRKPTQTGIPGAKPRPKASKGGQHSKK